MKKRKATNHSQNKIVRWFALLVFMSLPFWGFWLGYTISLPDWFYSIIP